MTNVLPIDALAMAIFHYEGQKPTDRNMRNNNPGNLRASPLPNAKDAGGYCVFESFGVGWAALLEDISRQFAGDENTRLGPTSTLYQFFEVYAPARDHNWPLAYAHFVAAWLTEALERPIATSSTLAEIQGGSNVPPKTT